MIFRYFVSFDENGEIKALYKSKASCEEPCEEYVIKLIPIKRDLSEVVDEFSVSVEDFSKDLKKTTSELHKVIKQARRII
jgi:hypothetical protein